MEPINVFSFETRAEAAEALADCIGSRVESVLRQKPRARLALSGGSSPEACYRTFANKDFDFGRIDITLVDDRWVNPGEAGSNQDMIDRAFTNAKGVTVQPLKTDAANAVQGAKDLDAVLAAWRPFDVIVLGMGPDAHTASWFPGSPDLDAALDMQSTATLMGIDAADAPVAQPYRERITLTLPPVAEAGWIGVLLFGADKRDVLTRAAEQKPTTAPIRAVLDGARGKVAIFWAP